MEGGPSAATPHRCPRGDVASRAHRGRVHVGWGQLNAGGQQKARTLDSNRAIERGAGQRGRERRPVVASQLVLGKPSKCPKRPFCEKGLQDTLAGYKFKDFKALDVGGPLTVEGAEGRASPGRPCC